MRQFLIPLFATLFINLAYSQTDIDSSQVHQFMVKTEKGDLHGTLMNPNENKETVVLIIAGSGPTDRNGNQFNLQNNSLQMLANGLYANEIASYRFDKRGVAMSQSAGIVEADLRFEHYVNDAKTTINWLVNEQGFNKVIIIGHSEGSTIGLLASLNNDKVAKYISLAGPAMPADELIKEQLRSQPPQVLQELTPYLDSLKQGNQVKSVPPMYLSLLRPTVQPYLISWMKYNPSVEIAKLTIPALIIQGTTDFQVSAQQAEMLAAAKPDSELKLIEGMNHIFKLTTSNRMQNFGTYNNPNLPIHSELVPTIIAFIKK